MHPGWKKCWPIAKILIAIGIVTALGIRFADDLQQPGLWDRPLRPEWLVLSGVLYLLALGLWAFYWHRLLIGLNQRPELITSFRAYFLGHMGKYLPGKAMALVLRASLVRGPGVHGGLAGLAAAYEVFVSMAAGALLAGLVFLCAGPVGTSGIDWDSLQMLLRLEEPAADVLDGKMLAILAGLLLLPLAVVILPGVFNRLASRLARPFRNLGSPPLPRFRPGLLVEGIGFGLLAWSILGLSLQAMLLGVLSTSPGLQWPDAASDTADLALAYVAGFVILIVPGGLGVREFFLILLLVDPHSGRPRGEIIVLVVMLRLAWTLAELLAASVVYWLPSINKVQDVVENARLTP